MFIEEGVRGENVKIGRAMIDALAAWVRMKGIGGRMVASSQARHGTQAQHRGEARVSPGISKEHASRASSAGARASAC